MRMLEYKVCEYIKVYRMVKPFVKETEKKNM